MDVPKLVKTICNKTVEVHPSLKMPFTQYPVFGNTNLGGMTSSLKGIGLGILKHCLSTERIKI